MNRDELRQAHQKQIARLTENPENIVFEWADGAQDPNSLFFNSPKLTRGLYDNDDDHMCLTIAKLNYHNGHVSPESRRLMENLGIIDDINIPRRSDLIKPEHLEHFSKYQLILRFGE